MPVIALEARPSHEGPVGGGMLKHGDTMGAARRWSSGHRLLYLAAIGATDSLQTIALACERWREIRPTGHSAPRMSPESGCARLSSLISLRRAPHRPDPRRVGCSQVAGRRLSRPRTTGARRPRPARCGRVKQQTTANGRPATAGSWNCSPQTGRSDLILNVSKVASRSPTGAPDIGHFRSSKLPEDRPTNDRSESTAE